MKRIIRPGVWTEISDAVQWYEGKEPGLGARFLDSLEKALLRIEENPYLYQQVDPEIRRGFMDPFPYGVYYAILGDRIEVLAVVNDARDPVVWKTRRL